MNIYKLRRLNFSELIKMDFKPIEDYSFRIYKDNGDKHSIKGFCTRCDGEKWAELKVDNQTYRLLNISHGSHAIDFFNSISKSAPDIANWHD